MEKIKGIIYACISAGTFGMIPLFANTAMREGVNNDTILVYRYVIAALVYGVYLAFRNISLKINRETLIELLWAGVGGYGITAYFLFLSYRYMPTGIATSIHYLYPVVVAVFMSLFYKQHLSIRVKGAIVLAILGVYFMSWSDGEIKWAGLIFALLTTFTYGTYIVALNRPHLKALNADALTFYSFVLFIDSWLEEKFGIEFYASFFIRYVDAGHFEYGYLCPAFGGGCGAYRIGSDFCTGHPGTDYSYHYRCVCFSGGIRN